MEGAVTGLENLQTVFTAVTGWMGSMATTITSEPLFLIPIGIFVAGAAIGLAGRLIGR